MDMWAFGQLILTLIHAQLPKDHQEKQASEAFKQGLQQMSADSRKLPGLLAHLQYLAGLQDDQDYADQVRLTDLDSAACMCTNVHVYGVVAICCVRNAAILHGALGCPAIVEGHECMQLPANLHAANRIAHATFMMLTFSIYGSVFASRSMHDGYAPMAQLALTRACCV